MITWFSKEWMGGSVTRESWCDATKQFVIEHHVTTHPAWHTIHLNGKAILDVMAWSRPSEPVDPGMNSVWDDDLAKQWGVQAVKVDLSLDDDHYFGVEG